MPRPCDESCDRGGDEFEPDSPYADNPLDDPEGPQACDLDGPDAETVTVPCPNCEAEIPDSADRCPYCGDWVVQGGVARLGPRGVFLVIVAVLLIVALLYWVL